MFILSEETSTKQIFEQTLSLITIEFCVLRCQKFWLPSLLLYEARHVLTYLFVYKIYA